MVLVPLLTTDALEEDLDETEASFQPHQCQRGPYFGLLCSVHFLLCLQGILQGPELGRVGVRHSVDCCNAATMSAVVGANTGAPKQWKKGSRWDTAPSKGQVSICSCAGSTFSRCLASSII